MPALSLAHLQMLSLLTEATTLSRAAESLLITQPALTHRIREAERRLGVKLYEKSGRRLRPTAAAQVLTDAAGKILRELDEAERIAIASAEGIQHVVRLTVGNYNTYHWLPGFLARFRIQHPEIEIELEPNSSGAAVKRLAEGNLDIAIVPGTAVPGSLDATTLFNDQLVAVVWPEHHFVGRPFVTAQDFKDQTYLTYSLASEPGFEADRLWSAENVSPIRKRNLGSIDAICELVKAQAGIAVLSRWGIERELALGNLAAIQATKSGIDISWRALVSNRTDKNGADRIVVKALAAWFGDKEPTP
jgi:LysR family transcriptional regulator for metE and metH